MSVNWDDYTPVNPTANSGINWDDFTPVAPKKKQDRSIGNVASDLAKSLGGAVVNSVGAVPTAVGRALQEGGEKLFGLTLDEAQRLAEAEGTPEKALEWQEKANRLNPVSMAGRAVESGGRWISQQGESLRDSRSDNAKEQARQSTPEGDITKPSSWTMGKAPTVEGAAHVLSDVAGSIAPQVAAAVATRGRSLGTQVAVGGAMGASQIGGAAIQEANELLSTMPDDELRKASPVFRTLESKGYSAKDARTIITRDAENRASAYAAPVGMAGGQATGAILGKAGERLAGGFSGVAAKAAVLGALGAAEEGIQEVGEGVATRAGINDATGLQRSLTDGTFAEFVLGAAGGGGVGAAKGAAQGVSQRSQPGQSGDGNPGSEGNEADTANPAITPETGNSAGSPVAAATPITPETSNGLARLVELDLLSGQRKLTPEEDVEAREILSALMNQEGGGDTDQQATTVQSGQQAADAAATPVDAAQQGAATGQAGPGAADIAGQSEQTSALASRQEEPIPNLYPESSVALPVVSQVSTTDQAQPALATPPKDFWSFAKGKGFTPGQIQVGSQLHAELKAEYDSLKAGSAAPVLPPMQPQQNVDLQNRDRGRAASVVQMSEIARNPDYMRLGPSRTPDSGAPMVFAVGDQIDIDPQAFGRQDVAVMSDGQRVPFRYAVVDATKVNPSNFADGRQNPDFNSTAPGTLKALNNGRTAGLRAAHELGTAGEYVSGLQADEAMHGIAADVISRVPNPMLVRVYSDGQNTAGMAAKSQGQGLGMSPAELARQDAPLMDSSVLSVYEPGEVTSAANRDFVRAFVGKLQSAGQDVAGMMTGDGQLSQDGRKRIQAALMQAAYGDSDIVEEMFDSTDTDIKAIGEALKTVAGQWANMRDSAKLGAINPQVDVTQNLIQAIGLIRKARRDNTMVFDLVNQPDLMTGEAPDPTTVGLLRMFYSGQYMTRAVGKDRLTKSLGDYLAGAMATSADAGMFGDVVTAGDILATIIRITEGQGNAETQPQEGGGEPVGSGTAGRGTGEERGRRQSPGEGGAGSDQDSRGQPGQDAQVEAGQQVGQGNPEAEAGNGSTEAGASGGQQDAADQPSAATGGRAGEAEGESVKPKKLAAKKTSPAEPANDPTAIDREKLGKDFRTFATLILNNILERGEVAKLYKAAGVKGAKAFDHLPIDDKAAAYVKFVEQGGKAVDNLPKDYDAWVSSQERAAEVARLQSDKVVRQTNGKPFKTQTSAQQFQERYELTGTHEVAEASGGFELRQLSPAAQAELKREADGRESYTDAQAAVAAEMDIGTNGDGEWDATDAQFDEMERRIDARLRGKPSEPLLTAPTVAEVVARQDAAEAAQRKAEADKRRADEEERSRRERADIEQASVAAADTFELGQDAMANLSGQQDIFGAPDKSSYADGQVLQAGDLLGYFDSVIYNSEKGRRVVNPRFHLGEVDAKTAEEIAIYIDGYDGKQRRLRVSGRTLKHVYESRPTVAREIVEQLPSMFSKPDEVLPDHKHPRKRALLVKVRQPEEGQSKPKSYVATVEVEIEVEVSDGFIDIVTIMTAPERSLKEARELKKSWSEGQQRTEQAVNSPHPLTAEAANPAADFPDARPADESVPSTTDEAQGKPATVENFVANVKAAPDVGKNTERYPYLMPNEIAPIASAFDSLFGTIQAKETTDGKISLLSRGAATGGGLGVKALQSLVDGIKARNPNLPTVHVLEDPSTAPLELRKYINQQDAWYDVEGAMHDGELYLFASGLSDPLRAEHVLIEHEAAHYGLRAILGEKVTVAMNLVYANNGRVRAAATEMQKRGRLSNAEAAEEVIVDIPTAELAKLTGWRKVVAMASDWLGAHGYERTARTLTDWVDGSLNDQQRADLFVAELVRGARDYVAGKRSGESKVTGTRLASSLADDIAKQEKWLQAEARERGYTGIDDLLEKNYPLFEKLASLWRKKNPGGDGSMLSQVRERPDIDARPPTQSKSTLPRDGLGAGPVAPGDTSPSLSRATRGDSTERGGTAGAGSRGIITPEARGGNRDSGRVAELPEETLPRYLQRKVQDNLNRFTVMKEWLASQGVALSDAADVFKAEERMHARYANKAQDFREKTLNPLIQKIQQAGFTLDDVAQFLHAQHAEERNIQVARLNRDRPDGGSGMTTAEANRILASAPAELSKLANEFRQIAENTKTQLLDAGIISRNTVEAWDSAYKHYVPLKGGPDGAANKSGTGKGLSAKNKQKRALGHDVREEGEWILENIVADHERALMTVEKNRVGLHLIRMAAEAGRDDLMTIGKPKVRQVLSNQSAYVVEKNGVRFGVYQSEEAAKLARSLAGVTGVTISKTNEPSVVLMATPQLQDNEVNVYVHGMEVRVQINDELLARAYKNMGDEALGAILEAGRSLNAYFSKIYTGYNPEFIQVNLFRDFTSGLINLTGEQGFGMAVKAARNYPKRFIELFRYARTNNETPWVKMYREDGGNTGAAYLSDMERLGADIATEYAVYQGVKKNLDDMRAAKTGKDKMKAGWLAARAAGRKVFEKTLVWVERLNQAGENAMRLAAYQAMIESGRTRNEAASAAKNVTVNFNRKGELGKQANALYLFFNAGVQGTAAIAHAHMKGKYKGQARALSGSLVALGYMASLLAAGGDDEDEAKYEEVKEHERSRNMLIAAGDGFAKIPIPYGYGFFWNMGRSFADSQRTGEVGKLPWQLATSLIGEFTPFGNAVAGSEPDAKQAFLYTMPTAGQIVGAPLLNLTGMGSPMMPESAFDPHQPDRDRMWRQTRGSLADTISGALEAAGIDVSPETLKHYGRTFTGGAGTFLTSVSDAMYLSLSGSELETSEIPFLRKMYMVPDVRGARARYNEAKNEVTKYLSGYQRAIKAENFELAGQMAIDNAEMLDAARMAKSFSQMASAQRDMIDNIRLKGHYSKAEERKLIEELEAEEREIYRDYLDELKGLKRLRDERR